MDSYNFYPITIIDEDRLLIFKRGSLYVFNAQFLVYEKKIRSFKIPIRFKILYSNRLIIRIFRLNRIISLGGDEGVIFFIYNNVIYKLDVNEDICERFAEIDRSKKTLKAIYVKNNNTFSEGIYYGEYFSNPKKSNCSIYYIDLNGTKKCVYTFHKGSINHIHSLLEDRSNECIWIFTGDFDNAAGIWKATRNFQDVEPILIGKQEYRACIGFWDKHYSRLVYATDTPFKPNTLRTLSCINGKWTSSVLHNINGSVIYGLETSKYLFFSSTVESNGIYKNRFDLFISRKKGDGIKDYFTYLYQFNKETQELKIIFKQKKDLLPFVLFQFGTMIFPSGTWSRDFIPILCIATKKYDLKTLFIKNN